jgi:hypothetical protein
MISELKRLESIGSFPMVCANIRSKFCESQGMLNGFPRIEAFPTAVRKPIAS